MGTYSWLCVSTLRVALDVPPGAQKYGSRYDGFERPLGDESTPLRNRQLFPGTGITPADTLDLSRFVSVERREELIGLGYNLELFVTTFVTRVTVAIAANDGARFLSRMDQIVDDNGVPVAGLAGAACLVDYIYIRYAFFVQFACHRFHGPFLFVEIASECYAPHALPSYNSYWYR